MGKNKETEKENKLGDEFDPVGDAVVRNFKLITIEILFSIAPMIILIIVYFYKGNPCSIFALPELSFIAAILFGQTLLKTISGSVAFASKASLDYQPVILQASLIIIRAE